MDIGHLRSLGLPLVGSAVVVHQSESISVVPANTVETSRLASRTETIHQVIIDGRLRYLPPEGPVGLPTMDQNSQELAQCMRRPLVKKHPDRQLSVVSFNMLLKGFDRKHYYPSVGPELRAWPWRKEQLQQLLVGLDADIYCLQEVDCSSFAEEMSPWLLQSGYASVDPKDDAKGKYPDMAKTAILYKQNLLQKVWEEHRSRVVLAAFRHMQTGRLLHVASCHLEGAPKEVATRFTQCKKALESIARHQKTIGTNPRSGGLFFAGDFNETEDGAVCHCLAMGGLKKEFRAATFPDEEIVATDFTHPFELNDLYATDSTRSTARASTFCAPPEDSAAWGSSTAFAAVDFLYYSPHTFRPVAIRQPFSPEQLKATEGVGIPSTWHFSDHVPIGGIFDFNDDEPLSGTNAEMEII